MLTIAHSPIASDPELMGGTIVFRGTRVPAQWNTRCAPSLNFLFLSNGHKVPTAKISIGSAGGHPAHNPFRINRSA